MKEISGALEIPLGFKVVFRQEQDFISFQAKTEDIVFQEIFGTITENGVIQVNHVNFDENIPEESQEAFQYHMRRKVSSLFLFYKDDILPEIKKEYQERNLASLKASILAREKELQSLRTELNILESM